MLLWLKQGHEFHEANAIDDCLFCGNAISADRIARLASALDDRIDQFVARLTRTAERLQEVNASLSEMERALPDADALSSEMRPGYREVRTAAVEEARAARAHLAMLAEVLAAKRERPAMPADISLIPLREEVASTVDRLAAATSSVNVAVEGHNAAVGDFTRRKEEAESAIRWHFLTECRDEYAKLAGELDGATAKKEQDASQLAELREAAAALRQRIRAHGPAAGMINRTVACYLGHSELTVHPVDEGYQLQRHGKPLAGAPSEGEKTAIAISYFLSSIEADNRRIGDAIVVVDDPVSSLDTKALNFACSLVRNRLEKAGQLFILTHNLQCMNEFKKAWKGKAREGGEREPMAAFLFIDVAVPEGEERRRSTIVRMSKLLREYDSEYHFLFSHLLRFLERPDAYDDHKLHDPQRAAPGTRRVPRLQVPRQHGPVGAARQPVRRLPGTGSRRPGCPGAACPGRITFRQSRRPAVVLDHDAGGDPQGRGLARRDDGARRRPAPRGSPTALPVTARTAPRPNEGHARDALPAPPSPPGGDRPVGWASRNAKALPKATI